MKQLNSNTNYSNENQATRQPCQELSVDEASTVSGGIALGPSGLRVTTVLEVPSVLDGS